MVRGNRRLGRHPRAWASWEPALDPSRETAFSYPYWRWPSSSEVLELQQPEKITTCIDLHRLPCRGTLDGQSGGLAPQLIDATLAGRTMWQMSARVAGTAAAVVVLFCVSSAAHANSCWTRPWAIHPGLPTSDSLEPFPPPAGQTPPALPVGRACTIEVYALVGLANSIRPENLVLTSQQGEIPFDSSPPMRLRVDRPCGCSFEKPMTCTIEYDRYVLAPRDPLPENSSIRVARRGWTTGLVEFRTTERLDAENCLPHAGLPAPTHCSPPIQDCPPLTDEGGSGCSLSPAGGRQPATEGLLTLLLALAARRLAKRTKPPAFSSALPTRSRRPAI